MVKQPTITIEKDGAKRTFELVDDTNTLSEAERSRITSISRGEESVLVVETTPTPQSRFKKIMESATEKKA